MAGSTGDDDGGGVPVGRTMSEEGLSDAELELLDVERSWQRDTLEDYGVCVLCVCLCVCVCVCVCVSV
jgi:hypothetical protein